MAVDLAMAKKHLRVGHNDEDTEITLYLNAAVDWTMTYTNRTAVPVGASAAFDAATLLMLGDLYEHREIGGGPYSENPAARRLLDPYRLLRV